MKILRHFLSASLFIFSIPLIAFSQNSEVTGRVTDKTDFGIPGITVEVKGTTNGTFTDFDGRYTIKLADPANATLKFSGIGYVNQEIKVDGQTELNVVMAEEVNSLNEVVVTALGVEREEKALGYSVQRLDSIPRNVFLSLCQ